MQSSCMCYKATSRHSLVWFYYCHEMIGTTRQCRERFVVLIKDRMRVCTRDDSPNLIDDDRKYVQIPIIVGFCSSNNNQRQRFHWESTPFCICLERDLKKLIFMEERWQSWEWICSICISISRANSSLFEHTYRAYSEFNEWLQWHSGQQRFSIGGTNTKIKTSMLIARNGTGTSRNIERSEFAHRNNNKKTRRPSAISHCHCCSIRNSIKTPLNFVSYGNAMFTKHTGHVMYSHSHGNNSITIWFCYFFHSPLPIRIMRKFNLHVNCTDTFALYITIAHYIQLDEISIHSNHAFRNNWLFMSIYHTLHMKIGCSSSSRKKEEEKNQ